MTILSLEGNIGSGKDIVIQFFKKYFREDMYFLEDSVSNWLDEDLLKNFYNDPCRWALSLEIHSTIQKHKRLNKVLNCVIDDSIIVTRRSPMSDRTIFVSSCKEMGYVNSKEFSIYDGVFESLNFPKYQGIIYLKSNVNKCYENIISKKNGVEKTINFEYIRSIHNNYEKWINTLKTKGVPLLEIDMENFRDIDGNEKKQEELLNIITKKFPKLKKFIKQWGDHTAKWTVVKRKGSKKSKENALGWREN